MIYINSGIPLVFCLAYSNDKRRCLHLLHLGLKAPGEASSRECIFIHTYGEPPQLKKALTFISGALTFADKQALSAHGQPCVADAATVLHIYAKSCINIQFGTYRKLFYMFHRPFSACTSSCTWLHRWLHLACTCPVIRCKKAAP